MIVLWRAEVGYISASIIIKCEAREQLLRSLTNMYLCRYDYFTPRAGSSGVGSG